MTPSGTRTRSMRMPFGRRHDAMTAPTGSLSLRMTSSPAAMASIRSALSVKPVEESGSRAARTLPRPRPARWRPGSPAARRAWPWPWRQAHGSCVPPAQARAHGRPCALSRPISRIVAFELSGTFDRLKGGIHGLDPSRVQRFLPCSARPGEAARRDRCPQQSTGIRHLGHRVRGTCPKVRMLRSRFRNGRVS